MSTVQVEYVGKKDQRADTVAGTGLVWYGAGDVKDVPVDAALKLARHPDVWRVISEPAARTLDDEPKTGEIQGLYGTDKLPSMVDITDKEQAQLGDIVRAAFAVSDMTPEEWNALEPEIRDELILGHLEKIRADFNKPPTTKPAAKKPGRPKRA